MKNKILELIRVYIESARDLYRSKALCDMDLLELSNGYFNNDIMYRMFGNAYIREIDIFNEDDVKAYIREIARQELIKIES